jgi:hypothetical protein
MAISGFGFKILLASVSTTDCRVPVPGVKESRQMEPIKASLRPLCLECPEVEITDRDVTIGEGENTVRLTHAEWNELVGLIKRGELGEV